MTDYLIRFYAEGITLEKCEEIINIASPIIEENVSQDEIKKTNDYIKEYKSANGYYYGEHLGIVLLGNENKGFSLMLKND